MINLIRIVCYYLTYSISPVLGTISIPKVKQRTVSAIIKPVYTLCYIISADDNKVTDNDVGMKVNSPATPRTQNSEQGYLLLLPSSGVAWLACTQSKANLTSPKYFVPGVTISVPLPHYSTATAYPCPLPTAPSPPYLVLLPPTPSPSLQMCYPVLWAPIQCHRAASQCGGKGSPI